MSLAPATRLGAYEIIALIGAGGMGEVYRARDARLGRDVAIKILPSSFSADSDRLSRFEQEARASAALNHPGILAVYDIGASDGAPYIVSELLEGETLREKLQSGPVPVRKAIELGIQIAQALAAAHDKGIVHRDLKPENIFINEDGRPKILDFGLAKLVQTEGAPAGASSLPTTPVHTQHGMVMGTLGYMAPEQVRGLNADHRADIFAFGAVAHEMLSGRRAFGGETTADTMTAILKEDPADLPIAERKIPPALALIVDRCLEKNPSGRFASAADLAFALGALTTQSGATAVVSAEQPKRRRVSRITLAAAVAAGLCAVALMATLPFAIAHFREAPLLVESTRFAVEPPEGSSFAGTAAPAISPDGRQLAFLATSTSRKANVVWVRSLDALDPRELPGTENAGGGGMFWSPDSRFIAFFADGKLKKIPVAGGPSQTLAEAQGTGGSGSWNQAGVIIFGRTGTGGVVRVSASGGQLGPVTVPDASRNETSHLYPSFLADGKRFLYYAFPAAKIYLGALDSKASVELTTASSKAIYAAPGHVVFTRQGTLVAQAFDEARGTLGGDAVPIAENLGVGPAAHAFTVSDNGVLAYRSGLGGAQNQIAVADRGGKIVNVIGDRADYRDISVSPDGTRLVVHRHEDPNGGGLWLVDIVRGTTSRFTFDQSHDFQAQWSPDGRLILFGSVRQGAIMNLFQKNATGAGSDEAVLAMRESLSPTDWSRDGRFIVYDSESPKTLMDIWTLPLSGDRKPTPFLQTKFSEGQGRLSPDSRWLAYVSNETGRNEVYVQPFPPSGGKWQVSTGGGTQPQWRRDGKELYYLSVQEQGLIGITAVDVRSTATTFDVSLPKVVFAMRFAANAFAQLPLSSNTILQSYAPSADGQRFFVLTPGNDGPIAPITVVMNWTAGLNK